MQSALLNSAQLEACLKCNICASVCPMMEVNPAYPGPKKAGVDGERYRIKDGAFFDPALRYCLHCKRCEVACPSGVKIADIIEMAKLRYQRPEHRLRNWALSHTDVMGHVAVPFAPVVNAFLRTRLASGALALTGIASSRQFPRYSGETFEAWFHRHVAFSQRYFARHVFYFHGCYVQYNNPDQGRQLVTVLNALGIGVRLIADECCCGVAMMSNGDLKGAESHARTNVTAITQAIASHEGDDAVVLTTSPSCALMMREEYADVLGVDNTAISHVITLATKWLYEQVSDGLLHPVFRDGYHRRVFYHIPCHLRRLGWQTYTMALLRLIPGIELIAPEQQCCGIAGTFGYKEENSAYSDRIGEKLFAEIEQANPDIVVTDCETCRWQLEMHVRYPVVHPLEMLLLALDIDKTTSLNNHFPQ